MSCNLYLGVGKSLHSGNTTVVPGLLTEFLVVPGVLDEQAYGFLLLATPYLDWSKDVQPVQLHGASSVHLGNFHQPVLSRELLQLPELALLPLFQG